MTREQFEKKIDEYKDLIIESSEEFFKESKLRYELTNNKKKRQISLLETNFNALKKKSREGTINDSDYSVRTTKINKSLFEFVDELRIEDFVKITDYYTFNFHKQRIFFMISIISIMVMGGYVIYIKNIRLIKPSKNKNNSSAIINDTINRKKSEIIKNDTIPKKDTIPHKPEIVVKEKLKEIKKKPEIFFKEHRTN